MRQIDKIKQMSAEALADMLEAISMCEMQNCKDCPIGDCNECNHIGLVKWLESEVAE